jgi:hypothetical protein
MLTRRRMEGVYGNRVGGGFVEKGGLEKGCWEREQG